MFSRILVCADGSQKSIEAATVAAEIALKFGSDLILLSVFDPSVIPAATVGIPDGSLQTTTDAGAYADERQNRVEAETSKVLGRTGVEYTTHRELGHPVDRIISTAQDKKVDLIVMDSRGLGGFERLVLGSTSEGVLRHAHCPVLIVR